MQSITKERDKAVRRTVSYAFKNVPFYRQLFSQVGLSPSEFRGADDLSKLPIIDSGIVARSPHQFLASNIRTSECLSLQTSGSSGVSRTIHVDRASIFRNAAQGERERSMIAKAVGRRYGYREAVIVLKPELAESSTPRVQRFMRSAAYFPSAVEVSRIYIDATEPPEAYLPRLNQFAPDIIQGYGSTLDQLLDYVTTANADFHKPRVAYFHSDGIAARTRAILQSQGIAVFSTYEACEALKIGFECEAHRGYHVNIDTYPVRIVGQDWQTLPFGEKGRVVVSNLSNRAMVLLNIDLGDQAEWLSEPCRCGRTLPRLALLEGSPIGSIRLPSGKMVNPSEIYQLFLGESALREHQVVHIAPGLFRLYLVVSSAEEREACGHRISRAFDDLFGSGATAEIVFVERIPLSRSGKKRSFVPLGHA